MTRRHASVGGAIAFIVALSWGEFAMLWGQYAAQFDGVVIARSEFVRYPLWSRNLVTRYLIREADGRERAYYADPSQGHSGGFSIGTHLRKRRWRMDYEADGQERNDFPFPLYLFWAAFDVCLIVACAILGIMMTIRDQRERELEAAYERAQEDLLRDDRER